MAKFLKRVLFWLFILALLVLMGYLIVITYVQANCSRAVKYLVEKYEIEEKDIRALKYEEYVYSDITNCDSLWLKKCTDDENLLYSFILKTKSGDTITVKQFKNSTYDDNYKKGKIRDSYQENTSENIKVSEEKLETN